MFLLALLLLTPHLGPAPFDAPPTPFPGVPYPGAATFPGAATRTPGVDPVGTWPLSPEPRVVHGFDPPSVQWGAGHRGVDLAGTAGQPVLAALAGTVSFAGSIGGKRVVVVDHGATRTTYEPVTASTALGSQVAAGAVIGHLDPAPSHCAPVTCLHWGWRRGEEYLDPLGLVDLTPVRLLPLAGGTSPDPPTPVAPRGEPAFLRFPW